MKIKNILKNYIWNEIKILRWMYEVNLKDKRKIFLFINDEIV